MFIKTISDMQNIWEKYPEIRLKTEVVDGVNIGIVCYMIATPNLFDDPLARECRGVTFNLDTGEILCRPFHKFFNVAEKPETQPNLIDVNKIISMKPKLDGSMLTPVLINNKIFWKTKKSFYSSVAIKVQKWFLDNGEPLKDFILTMLQNNITPIYEFIAPDNRIVVEYSETQLYLLELRDNYTGGYKSPPTTPFKNEFKDCFDLLNGVVHQEGIEGYVLRIGDEFYKVKTKWYLDRHHLLSKFSVRAITDMVLDETIDDVLGGMVQLGLENKTLEIRKYHKEITDFMLSLVTKVREIFSRIDTSLTQKEFAELVLREHKEISGELFALRSNKGLDSVIKKKTKYFFYEKYKGIVLFMGE